MSAVMHGRRKGQMRCSPELPTKNGSKGQLIPNTVDLRQVTVLSKADWEAIQQTLNKKQIEEARLQQKREEREALKQHSKDMVKNWGNTIQGQRQRKLQARKLREEKEEAEKVQIDLEEAKFQAQQRKDIIERAKTQQYYQTDRVKNFHAALLQTEVLKEREAQIELKRLKERANDGKDSEWLERARKEYELAVKLDQEKAADRINRCNATRDFQKAQINQHLKERQREASQDRTEGEELKKLGLQYEIEKERLENIKRDERRMMMMENNKQIDDVKKIKQLQAEQEEEEDEECRIFAAAKRKMMKLRAEKERDLAKNKQTSLEKIREKLAAQMKQKTDDEDDRIRNAFEEAEARRSKEEKDKEDKMRRMLQEAAEHRTEQMREAEERKKLDRRQELEILKVREAADQIFHQNEMEKRARKYDEAKALSDFHLYQADQFKNAALGAKQQQLALDKANVDLLALEERQFQEYAGKVIEHCEQGGRNVYPLQRAAKEGAGGGVGPIFAGKGGTRPSYMVSDNSGVQMPHYQRDTTEEVKDQVKGNSGKRLGFVW